MKGRRQAEEAGMSASTLKPVCLEDLGPLTDLYEQHVAAGEYEKATDYLSRPYRIYQLAFWWDNGYLTVWQLRQVLLYVWEDTESPHRNYRLALRLFRAAGFGTNSPEKWAALPDVLEVWRGTNHLRPKGLSWTGDRDLAVWFARRFVPLHGNAYLVRGRILKRHVFAFCHERRENEIVVNPVKVRILGVSDALAPEEDAAYERIIERFRQERDAKMEGYKRRSLLRELGNGLASLPGGLAHGSH